MMTEKRLSYGPVTGMRVGGALIGRPLMTSIFYYVDNLLIDTGCYNTRKILDQFSDVHKIDQVVLTHYHEDHAGNAGFLSKKLNVPIYGNPYTEEALRERVKLKPYEYLIFGRLESAPISLLPDVVETMNYRFEPIYTPGHSRDHTVYFEASQGWVFSGDLFLGSKIKFWRKDEDMLATIASLEAVLTLEFDSLFCGHNPKLGNPKKFIRMKLERLLSLIGCVKDLQGQGCTNGEVISRLCRSKEVLLERILTIGDVSYKNMVVAAINAVSAEAEVIAS